VAENVLVLAGIKLIFFIVAMGSRYGAMFWCGLAVLLTDAKAKQGGFYPAKCNMYLHQFLQ